jgi:hypothetical protein
MTEGFKGRREDLRLITGRGRYTADWERPGQLFGHFLRSDRAHAEIVRIDITEASRPVSRTRGRLCVSKARMGVSLRSRTGTHLPTNAFGSSVSRWRL